jgi:hypothetical protein
MQSASASPAVLRDLEGLFEINNNKTGNSEIGKFVKQQLSWKKEIIFEVSV